MASPLAICIAPGRQCRHGCHRAGERAVIPKADNSLLMDWCVVSLSPARSRCCWRAGGVQHFHLDQARGGVAGTSSKTISTPGRVRLPDVTSAKSLSISGVLRLHPAQPCWLAFVPIVAPAPVAREKLLHIVSAYPEWGAFGTDSPAPTGFRDINRPSGPTTSRSNRSPAGQAHRKSRHIGIARVISRFRPTPRQNVLVIDLAVRHAAPFESRY